METETENDGGSMYGEEKGSTMGLPRAIMAISSNL